MARECVSCGLVSECKEWAEDRDVPIVDGLKAGIGRKRNDVKE